MHIVLVSTWDIKCGISLYTENLYREIADQGHQVTVLAEVAEERNRRYEVSEDGVVRCWKRGDSWKPLLELIRGLRGVDVVNVQHEMSYCWEPHLWHQLINGLHAAGLPVMVTYHTIPFAPNPITDNPEVDGIIVCNPKAREAMIRRGWPAERVWRVQHGVFPPCPPPPPRGERTRLAVYGFLAGQKGYSEVMEAMQRLSPKHPDLRLTIFGSLSEYIKERQEAYYYDDLRREITHRGLQNRVAVLMGFPHQEMLHHMLADHDILVLYYRSVSVGYCESGALHTGFAACRPTIVSTAHHFDCSPETADVVLKAASVDDLTLTIDRLVNDSEYYDQRLAAVREFSVGRPVGAAAGEYVQAFEALLADEQVADIVASAAEQREPALPLLGVVLLSTSSRPALLDRAIQSVSDTSPGIPVVVVDPVAAPETVDLMRTKWDMVTYICSGGLQRTSGAGARLMESLRMGMEALPARYAKVVTEDDVMLRGWHDEHERLCRVGASLITCAGIFQNATAGQTQLLDKDVLVSTQVCLSRQALAELGGGPQPGTGATAGIGEWLDRIRSAGYGGAHVPVNCFLRSAASPL
jgi:glycosyltransferase involved in cell wall biosynthesis